MCAVPLRSRQQSNVLVDDGQRPLHAHGVGSVSLINIFVLALENALGQSLAVNVAQLGRGALVRTSNGL